jgi:reactive intermediate/imine deaminase
VRSIITTDEAPAPAGPYSQGVVSEDFVFTAGQIPTTPSGETLNDQPIDVQTRQCLENITEILNEAGLEIRDIVKVTVFLSDIELLSDINEVYEEFFDAEPPARSAIAVSGIAKNVDIEIEAIAVKNQ